MSAANILRPTPKCQCKIARRHVELLRDFPDATVCIRLLDDDKGRKPKLPARNLTGKIDDLWPEIEAAQAEGYGVFIVVNEGGHKDDDITRIRANFIDADDIEAPKEFHVRPSLITRRDTTHWHAYWFVSDVPVETFTHRQKRLVAHYGSDPAVCNPSRVMRLAGTLHLKGAPKLVTLEEDNANQERWELIRSKVMRGLPKLVEAERKAASSASGDPVGEAHLRELLGYLDPDQPYGEWRDVIAGIRATPLVDDPDESKRFAIALEWSRGDLDISMLYEHSGPKRFTGEDAVRECFESMPPKEGGVSYGTIYKRACDGGFNGPPARSSSMQDRYGHLVDTKGEPAPKRSRFYPMGEAEMENLPPPRWLVHNLIIEGTSVLMVGETQSYKSFMALDIALAIATGTETFGSKPVPGPTFYAALEGLYDVMGQRREAWKIARGFTERIDSFYALPAPTLNNQKDCDEFIDQIRLRCDERPDRARPKLIVLETLNRLLDGLNESDAASASLIAKLCEALITEFGCSVVVVHHKSDKVGASDVRGSSGFRANFDSVLSVEADRASKTAEVWVLKHKGAPEPNEAFCFQGHVVGPSLAFQPITKAEHREKLKKEDAYSRANVGEILKKLQAYGPQNGVTTVVLARNLLPKQEGQSEERWLQIADNATRRLGERAKPDGDLEPYTHKGEGARGATIWCLPTTDAD